nr:ARID DNA-binding domain-containing protein [Tanacetum cinerariifolium]
MYLILIRVGACCWVGRYEGSIGCALEREIAESVGKIEEFRRLCIELRANIRLRNDYISELRLYRSCDDILGTNEMLRRMQLDDTENVARLLSMATETQRKGRLAFLVNQEIMKDTLRVEDYKRMVRQLKESVRRRNGYIGALKARASDGDSIGNLKFLERVRLEDVEKGTRLLLIMKETQLKISEKSAFVSTLAIDVVLVSGFWDDNACFSMAFVMVVVVMKSYVWELSCESKIPKMMKFFLVHQIVGKRLFVNQLRDQCEEAVEDAMTRENNKLASLTQLMDQVNDGIRKKEAHVDIMDLFGNSVLFRVLARSVVAFSISSRCSLVAACANSDVLGECCNGNKEMLKEYAGLVILLWVYLQNLQLLDAWYMLGIGILWSDISGITLVESATCISYFLTNSEQSNPVRTLAFRAKKVNIVVAEWSAMNALKFYIYVNVLAASDRKFVLLEVTLNILSIDLLEKQGYEIKYKGNRCSLVYMFNNKESQKFDEDRMRTMHNQYLEEFFKSLDASMDEDLIQIKGNLYSTKVNNFKEYVAFLNLIKRDEVVSQEWDIFINKFNKVVKWFYNCYLERSLPGPIPPTINGVQIHLFDLYKLVEELGGYLSVYFSQEFNTIREILGLSKGNGEEIKRCYINYLDVFTSYFETARAPQQGYKDILEESTRTCMIKGIDHANWDDIWYISN